MNNLGIQEDTLAYIIRHTQLLPREFLRIFARAILESRSGMQLGMITSSAIKKSVSYWETDFGTSVLKPYEKLYGKLLAAVEDVMPELPLFFSLADMDRLGHRFKDRIEEEISNPWELLYQMGVVGFVGRNSNDVQVDPDSERYVYAYFCYNSTTPISFANHRVYCVHPLFSKRWQMKRPEAYKEKFVYPANVEHFRVRDLE